MLRAEKLYPVLWVYIPDIFSPVAINLVEAGETSGTLDKALERIANQLEKDADVASKIKGAMVYPIVIICVMLGVVTFMMVKVVPDIKLLYTSFPGTSLPIETKLLLDTSNFVIKRWYFVVIVLGVIAIFIL